MSQSLIEVGYVAGAHGVRGQLKVVPHSQDTVLLHTKNWWLQRASEPAFPLAVKKVVQATNALLVTVNDLNDRDQAQALKGCTVWVSRADFPPTQDDEFYWSDLLGCTVFLADQPTLKYGVVSEVSSNGVHAILHLQRYQYNADHNEAFMLTPKGQPVQVLIPFVKAHIVLVDLEQQRIVVDWPSDF